MENQVATELKELKKVLTCLVCSTPLQMDLVDLLRDYGEIEERPLPIKDFGYTSFVDFLKMECNDILKLEGNPQNPIMVPIISKNISSANDATYFRNILGSSQKPRRSRGIDATTGLAISSEMISKMEQHNIHLSNAKNLKRNYLIMRNGPHGATWRGYVPDSVLESPVPPKKPKRNTLVSDAGASQNCEMCDLSKKYTEN